MTLPLPTTPTATPHLSKSPGDIEHLARKRAGAKLGWYTHCFVFAVVNLALVGASQYAWGQRPWSIFPVLGWGLGLTMHGFAVWVLGSGSRLRERMVQKEREHLRRHPNQH